MLNSKIFPFKQGKMKQKYRLWKESGFGLTAWSCLAFAARFVNCRLKIILTNTRPEAGWEGKDCHGGGGWVTQRALYSALTAYSLLPWISYRHLS